jgi:hypothetical protein
MRPDIDTLGLLKSAATGHAVPIRSTPVANAFGSRALGFEVMGAGQAVFDELRDEWKRKIGAKQLERLESDLATMVGGHHRSVSKRPADRPQPRPDDLTVKDEVGTSHIGTRVR